MLRYHINEETGAVNVCHATVYGCPLGWNAPHFLDKKQAEVHAEKMLTEQFGLFPEHNIVGSERYIKNLKEFLDLDKISVSTVQRKLMIFSEDVEKMNNDPAYTEFDVRDEITSNFVSAFFNKQAADKYYKADFNRQQDVRTEMAAILDDYGFMEPDSYKDDDFLDGGEKRDEAIRGLVGDLHASMKASRDAEKKREENSTGYFNSQFD